MVVSRNMTNLKKILLDSFEKNSDKRCIVYGDVTLTYKEVLNRLLKIERDIKCEGTSVFIIFMDRKIETVLSVISSIFLNKVFCAIDTNLPRQSILEIVIETGSNVIFTNKENYIKLPLNINNFCSVYILENCNICQCNEKVSGSLNIDCLMNISDLSHIVYTSGSTNRPKGVLASKRSLEQFINWEYELLNLQYENINVIQISNPWFDPYARDIFLPLFFGGTICIPNKREMFDSKSFFEFVKRNEINIIHIVPTIFRHIFLNQEYYDENGIKYILLAGEMLFGDDIKKYNKRYKKSCIYNLYGPTETTMSKFYHKVNSDDENLEHICVGNPFPNTYCKIIDENGKELPIENEGEIVIYTKYASLGYLNRKNENKTRFKFLDNDYVEYKTSDMGVIHTNGELEVVGRKDNMKKIYGQKVHSEEIEAVVLECKNVKNCAAYIENNKVKVLVVTDKNFELNELISKLKENLQLYKIPEKIIVVKNIPINKNGKIDRKHLCDLNASNLIKTYDIHL